MAKQLVTVDHRQRQESLEATDPCDFGPAESLQLSSSGPVATYPRLSSWIPWSSAHDEDMSSQNPEKKAETVRALQLSAQIILQPHQRLVEDLP